MDNKKLTTQMLDFYRFAFENSFAGLMTLHDQVERFANLYWGQMLAIPEEAKKGLAEWNKASRKNWADLKKVVDEGFKQLESWAA